MSLPRIWVLTDGAAGNLRQANSLANGLGTLSQTITINTAAPWRWLAPRKLPLFERALGPELAAALLVESPDLAIGCGRQAALATRMLRERGVPVVQILAPPIAPRHWNVIVTPAHDALQGGNVIQTLGSLHPIDDGWLAAARRAWPSLAGFRAPRTVVLLGGPTSAAPFNLARWQILSQIIQDAHARDGGSVLLSTSRRTPQWLRDAARDDLADLPGTQWHGEADGPNPYAGFLAWADRLVVSADSVNLLSEACATRAPVYALLPQVPRGRLARFHRSLVANRRLTPLPATLTMDAKRPLRELESVIASLRQRLDLGGKSPAG